MQAAAHVKKHRPAPQGDYITFEQFKELLANERDPAYRVCYNMSWYLVPRVSELNSFKPRDIDSGINKKCHTIKNYRNKTDIYDELPMPDFLYEIIMQYIKEFNVKKDDPIIDRHRTTIYQHMASSGIMTVGGKKKLHPHALRRGGAIYMYYEQKQPIALAQFYLGHTSPQMTERYISVTKLHAAAGAMEYVRGLKN